MFENKMRFFMNIVSETLVESVIKVQLRYGVLPVVKNPNKAQTTNMLNKFNLLRGIVDPDGNLYVWDAAEATHDDIDNEINVGVKHRFLMSNTTVTTQLPDAEALKNIPSIQRAYGRDFEVETDSDHDWEHE